MTLKKFEPATRQQVADILPSILRKTLQDYEDFVKEQTSTETKLFSQKQSAGKSALAHIMLLLKLAKWAGIEEVIEDGEDYTKALEIARIEFEKGKSDSTLDDEDDDDEAGFFDSNEED